MRKLLYSAEDIRAALKELGPPATKAEVLIFSASSTLADLLETEAYYSIGRNDDGSTSIRGFRL